MITKITDTLFAETYEDVRQIDVARLQRDLERAKVDRMEVKKIPDQETLDYWNNEATMQNEMAEATERRINETLQKVKDAGFKITVEKGMI